MESNTIPDYWNDDSGGGSDGELRHALESFRDVPPPDAGSGFKVYKNCCDLHQIGVKKRRGGHCSECNNKPPLFHDLFLTRKQSCIGLWEAVAVLL